MLSRWYDFEVKFQNPNIEKEEFVGVIEKGQKIEEILSILKKFKAITGYQIKNKSITLK